MSVYKKLQQARVRLQESKIKKSGVNTYSKYTYFELSDFIPAINEIFDKVGLCGIVSFTNDTAYLTIHDCESEGFITFTSPLVMAEMAKSQPIQSLGSTHTYYRRYLWLMAMEICEEDNVEARTGVLKEEVKPAAPILQKSIIPKVVTGAEGQWQIVATKNPGASDSEWLELIEKAAETLLNITASEADVLEIYQKNKSLFEIVKATDLEFHAALMAKFSERRNMFKKG